MDYNEHRLHCSLGDLTPAEYASLHQDTQPLVAV
ncbi:MAG: hypothetical protein IPF87_19295 [Gemmatimonadetes bacterium]|nr:hypothetical protein [Gemmatimonadota bacterium]MBK8058139.1 hypothetical protein [Gemmatimonadota bacterium]MBK9409929.1 hypothetical protein [Gemmatimonadota bacterium]